MPALSSYDYALVRVVPSVERGECLNVGVVLYCPEKRFLGALIHLDQARLLALSPLIDLELVERHLAFIPLVCKGGKAAGRLGEFSLSERFHWLVAPRSTIIQPSPPHSGLCSDPDEALRHLFKTMVELPPLVEAMQPEG